MTQSGAVFSQRTVAWLIAVGALAFFGMAYLLVYGDDPGRRSAGADSYSRSAIGHAAFAELLRQSGFSVQVSRYDTATKSGPGTLLIAAEPAGSQALAALLSAAAQPRGPLLVVLPKWRGRVSPGDARWLASAAPLPVREVEEILHVLVPDAGVARTGAQPGADQLGVAPTLDAAQLVVSDRLRPVVGSAQGMLVGALERAGRPVWILSDPDVIANHGIGDGQNAAFALALVEALGPPGGTVVIDETIHGFTQRPSLWRALVEPPVVLATLQALVTVCLLLWAGVGRFGPPLRPTPELAPGSATLIEAGANLVTAERHGAYILRRYGEAVLRELAMRLHAPAADRAAWLDRVGRARGVALSCRELEAELARLTAAEGASAARLTAVARTIHRWKREMLHGP